MIRPIITKIAFYGKPSKRFLTYVTIEFEGNFVIKDIKIVRLNEKMLLAMPARQNMDGESVEFAFPINREYRMYMETTIFDRYVKECIE